MIILYSVPREGKEYGILESSVKVCLQCVCEYHKKKWSSLSSQRKKEKVLKITKVSAKSVTNMSAVRSWRMVSPYGPSMSSYRLITGIIAIITVLGICCRSSEALPDVIRIGNDFVWSGNGCCQVFTRGFIVITSPMPLQIYISGVKGRAVNFYRFMYVLRQMSTCL